MADGATLTGYWLPTLSDREVEFHERAFGPGHVPVRLPMLTPHVLRELLVELRERRAATLAERPVAQILTTIEAAARSLTTPGAELREELLATLPALTGYSRQMVELGLVRMGALWTADALSAALEDELGSAEVLDDFRPRPRGGYQRAFGPALTVHVFSGNIPGVSVTSLIRALCVKSASLGKTAAGEPYFAVCFARALAEHDSALGACVAVTHWPGGSEDLESVAYSEAEAVVAYGSDETIAEISCRVPPQTRFIAYPNRLGAAMVARSALSRKGLAGLARGAAADVAAFDQQGCVSPHTIYLERGGAVNPMEFAQALAGALDVVSKQIPRGKLAPGESVLIHQLRARAEMRGATVLASEPGTDWTVILESGPGFELSTLNRVVYLRAVDDLAEGLAALTGVGRHLQTVALAAGPAERWELASRLGALGATRVVPIGRAAWPGPHWHHDGRFQFLDLVRLVDLERDTAD